MSVIPITTARDDGELLSRLRTLFTTARNEKRSVYSNWLRNYRLVNARYGGGGAAWQPAPRDSEIYPTLASLVAWAADQHTNVDVSAAADPGSPHATFMQQLSQDLGTIMQTNWLMDDYKSQVKLVLWDAFQYSIGIFKNVWDQGMDGGYGNCMLKRVDPWSFYPDPDATSLADCEYMIEARRMSINEIERRYPGITTNLRNLESSSTTELDESPRRSGGGQSTGAMTGAWGNLTSTQGGTTRWSTSRTGPLNDPSKGIIVYEFWIKENDEWYDEEKEKQPDEITAYNERHVAARWRVVVVAANEILLDEYADDLWSHGGHPYEEYRFDDTGEMYGIALVDHLAYPQIYLNRLLAALQHNAELVGNPIFMEAANSGLNRTAVTNRPGQRLTLAGTAGMQNKPEWMQPPQMPPQIQQLVDFWISRIDNISGFGAVKNVGSGDRMAQDVMSTIQEAAFVRVRSGLSNLESTLTRCAQKLADLIIENYTQPRIMSIIGATGEQSALALRQRHFTVATEEGAAPLKYSILVQAGASMPTSRQARMAMADKAYSLGIIDRQAWFEAYGYPNWQDVLERVNEQINVGTFNPPGARQRRTRT